jgi:hypothetical protein
MREPAQMILEGIVTTLCGDGSINVAPMGPIVDAAMQSLLLRPFQSSTTYGNLAARKCGVFHVTDDVELIARAAIGRLDNLPAMTPCGAVECPRLVDCCRWYAFRVESNDEGQPRAQLEARVVAHGRVRDFFGFNRAKHAVLEAAILATRLHLAPPADLEAELSRLSKIVVKTAGDQERRAFALLESFVQSWRAS